MFFSDSDTACSTAQLRGNHPRILQDIFSKSPLFNESSFFGHLSFSPNNQCLEITVKYIWIILVRSDMPCHDKMKNNNILTLEPNNKFGTKNDPYTHLFQRVTLTRSPISSRIRASSVHGGFMATLMPCDHSGIHEPVAGFWIKYVRVLALFSFFCAICSIYVEEKFRLGQIYMLCLTWIEDD